MWGTTAIAFDCSQGVTLHLPPGYLQAGAEAGLTHTLQPTGQRVQGKSSFQDVFLNILEWTPASPDRSPSSLQLWETGLAVFHWDRSTQVQFCRHPWTEGSGERDQKRTNPLYHKAPVGGSPVSRSHQGGELDLEEHDVACAAHRPQPCLPS